MAKQISITTLPESPDDERRSRMIRYTVVMSIRLACILLMFVFRGWWILLPAFGAVALPYFAVVAANAVGARRGKMTVVEPLGLPSRPIVDPEAPDREETP